MKKSPSWGPEITLKGNPHLLCEPGAPAETAPVPSDPDSPHHVGVGRRAETP